jgi:hypothetical protein
MHLAHLRETPSAMIDQSVTEGTCADASFSESADTDTLDEVSARREPTRDTFF